MSASLPYVNDKIAKKNAIILAIAFALGGIITFSIMSLVANIGKDLAADKSLATLPITTFLVASMITSVLASLLMEKVGRKSGFRVGIVFGFIGSLLLAYSIYIGSFYLLSFSTFLIGVMAAFQTYYRFAAADIASDKFKVTAVSWVMFGGILAPILAPTLIRYSKDLLNPYFLAGTFIIVAGVCVLAFIIISYINIPQQKLDATKSTGRPLYKIVMQPLFLISVLAAMVSYGLMTFVMTASPLAISGAGHGHDINDITFIIQWHVLAMYGPSFFTGKIINRIGAEAVVIIGLLLLGASAAVAAMGLEITHFWGMMVLLGLGWNFGFVGATAMLTEHYRPEEKFKAQAFNEFLVFSTLAIGSFAAGKMYATSGWNAVTSVIYPVIGITLIILIISYFLKNKTRSGL